MQRCLFTSRACFPNLAGSDVCFIGRCANRDGTSADNNHCRIWRRQTERGQDLPLRGAVKHRHFSRRSARMLRASRA
jgi:hypothetical protein